MKMKIISLLIFLLCSINTLGNEIVINGKIIDDGNSSIIPGARISIKNSNKGTYSASNGNFRLKVNIGDVISVSSIGYFSKQITIENQNDLEIGLKSNPIITKDVNVTSSITPEQIIERAIKKKNDNLSKIKTFAGQLYSKLIMEMDGSVVASSNAQEGTMSLTTAIGGGEENDFGKFLIMETISDVQKDYEKNITRTNIVSRRQTSNIKPDDNIMALSEFFSFYSNEINLLNTKIPSPIADDALDNYRYELLERQYYGEKFIYLIKVEPKTSVFPGFIGNMKILEGDYNLLEVDFEPSETTAIPFFEDLKIKQVYNSSSDSLWYPGLLEVKAKAKLDIIKSLIDFKTSITITSIYSDAKLNTALPDSVYIQEKPRLITVSPTANIYDSTYWEENSLRELSTKEKEIYTLIDSIYKSDTTKYQNNKIVPKSFDYSIFNPYFNFNRVGAVCIGLVPKINLYGNEIKLLGNYSFGQEKFYGIVGFETANLNIGKLKINAISTIFSKISTISWDKSYSELYNSIAGLINHSDYYDYSLNEGFDIGINFEYKEVSMKIKNEISNQNSLNKTTNNSIFESRKWRENPEITESRYNILTTELNYGKINTLGTNNDFDTEINLLAFYGNQKYENTDFKGIEGKLSFLIPTFYTGYNPMTLRLNLNAGISESAPVQYQFKAPTRLFLLNESGNLFTAPISYFGGDKYYMIDASFNLTDILWRWIGLPTYEGRGIDLIIGGTYGKFYNSTKSFYQSTLDDAYSEIGFGFSRIPTFISNVGYLSFDYRFGIGPIAKGRTGGAIMISLPF